jgi:hypothetical protein
MSNQEKQYVGNGKAMTGNFGVFHKLSFSAQDLETLKANLNQKGYVNIVMNERQSPSQYGATHSMVIDTWQPTPQGQAPGQPQQFQQAPQQQAPQQFQQGAPIPQEFQQVAQQPQQFQQPQQQQPQVGF